MTNTNPILTLFDREQRIDVTYYNMHREVTPDAIRLISPAHRSSLVIYSQLNANNADQVIREQIAYFEERGLDFEWKLYTHDTPADLLERLKTHGFEIGDIEAVTVLDLEKAPPSLWQSVPPQIQRLTDPEKLADVIAVQEQVWQEDLGSLHRALVEQLQNDPDHLSVYVAYVDELPVSSAWITFHPGSQFAGLWGGSTLPAYRKRGLYHALVSARAQEARSRGVRYLTVDASPMSRPILERLGFKVITFSYPCTWHTKKGLS